MITSTKISNNIDNHKDDEKELKKEAIDKNFYTKEISKPLRDGKELENVPEKESLVQSINNQNFNDDKKTELNNKTFEDTNNYSKLCDEILYLNFSITTESIPDNMQEESLAEKLENYENIIKIDNSDITRCCTKMETHKRF